MGMPDHLTCFLRNLYASQEATIRTVHGTTDWFQILKGVCQGCILLPCLFNLYAEYIMRNAGWMKNKLESRLLGDIATTSDMQITPSLWQKVKRTTLMASGPITSWQIDGKTMEAVTNFIFLGSKITADSDCSREIKIFAPWK